ncbi:DegT/DnrJ/EryC1/StrS family aminotransferase [Candidatus Pelagibacter sp.]|nr:DegT/DnrJ/EryC1/StrS family aminotransferase [Candidatus Pelagibacter sp.]
MKKISVFEPTIFKREKIYLQSCISKNEISTYGKFIEKFEKKIQDISSSKYCAAVTSGSVGLFLALKAIKIKKDELVISPSYTFAATTNAIVLANATPILFDIDERSMCIDLNKVKYYLENNTYKKKNYFYDKKTKKKLKAICPVTTFSIVPDLKTVKYLSKKFNLKIIIDAAPALTSKFYKKSLAAYADIVVFSFNGNKTFTCGGGGAVVSNNKSYIEYIKILSTNAKSKSKAYTYNEPAFNFKMTNLHAAVGLGQIENIKLILKKKKKIRKLYQKLRSNNFFLKPIYPKWSNHELWLNYIIFKKLKDYKLMTNKLSKINYVYKGFWKPMHLQKNLNFVKGSNFTYTNKIWNKIFILPSSISLKKKIQQRLIDIVNKIKFNETKI